MIPPIWFLEINRINDKLGIGSVNETEGAELVSLLQQGINSPAYLNDKAVSFNVIIVTLCLNKKKTK